MVRACVPIWNEERCEERTWASVKNGANSWALWKWLIVEVNAIAIAARALHRVKLQEQTLRFDYVFNGGVDEWTHAGSFVLSAIRDYSPFCRSERLYLYHCHQTLNRGNRFVSLITHLFISHTHTHTLRLSLPFGLSFILSHFVYTLHHYALFVQMNWNWNSSSAHSHDGFIFI